jgi:ParB-like chromosome segregation protein Spo0J
MIRFSEIRMVDIGRLRENVANKKFFGLETKQYFDNLSDDIAKHGIKVPLVAKKDGTLLAGHNRLFIAKSLELKKVPVQYVLNKLTPNEETEYIIKDNLLRRHLRPAEREALYKKLYKNFDQRVMVPGKLGLSARKIAEDTGLNPTTIGYDISRIKHKMRKEAKEMSEIDVLNEKAVSEFSRSVTKMINWAIVEKSATISQFITITESALERLYKIQ